MLLLGYSPSSALAQRWVCFGDKLTTPMPSWYFEHAVIDFDEGVWKGKYDFACIEGQAQPYTGGSSYFSDVPGALQECLEEFRYAMWTEDTLGLEVRYKDSGYHMPYQPSRTYHVVEFHSEDALYVRFFLIDSTGKKSKIQVIKKEYGTSKGQYKKFGQERYAVNMHCRLVVEPK
jgi:hypothetical protein